MSVISMCEGLMTSPQAQNQKHAVEVVVHIHTFLDTLPALKFLLD